MEDLELSQAGVRGAAGLGIPRGAGRRGVAKGSRLPPCSEMLAPVTASCQSSAQLARFLVPGSSRLEFGPFYSQVPFCGWRGLPSPSPLVFADNSLYP